MQVVHPALRQAPAVAHLFHEELVVQELELLRVDLGKFRAEAPLKRLQVDKAEAQGLRHELRHAFLRRKGVHGIHGELSGKQRFLVARIAALPPKVAGGIARPECPRTQPQPEIRDAPYYPAGDKVAGAIVVINPGKSPLSPRGAVARLCKQSVGAAVLVQALVHATVRKLGGGTGKRDIFRLKRKRLLQKHVKIIGILLRQAAGELHIYARKTAAPESPEGRLIFPAFSGGRLKPQAYPLVAARRCRQKPVRASSGRAHIRREAERYAVLEHEQLVHGIADAPHVPRRKERRSGAEKLKAERAPAFHKRRIEPHLIHQQRHIFVLQGGVLQLPCSRKGRTESKFPRLLPRGGDTMLLGVLLLLAAYVRMACRRIGKRIPRLAVHPCLKDTGTRSPHTLSPFHLKISL